MATTSLLPRTLAVSLASTTTAQLSTALCLRTAALSSTRALPTLQHKHQHRSLATTASTPTPTKTCKNCPSCKSKSQAGTTTNAAAQRTPCQIRAFKTSPFSQPPSLQSNFPPPQPVNATSPGASKGRWMPPTNAAERPVLILGAGVLGRRLAILWASTSRRVILYDTSPQALDSARAFVADGLTAYCAEQGTHPGHVSFVAHLEEGTTSSPWMVIECLLEDLELKTSVLGRVNRLVGKDCVIATASASFVSRELVWDIPAESGGRERVLNTLYYIPPTSKSVELMSCGATSAALFPFLVQQMQDVGLRPMIVGSPSSGLTSNGLVFPRLWTQMKREALKMLSSGTSSPEMIDRLFKDFFGAERGVCEMMDRVGLDTVARGERHALKLMETHGEGTAHVEWLEREFVAKGKLGEKSGEGLVVKKRDGKVVINEAMKVNGEVWKEHAVDFSGL